MAVDVDIESNLGIDSKNDDGPEITVINLDLCDVVTLDRIVIPVKGANCQHAQCFDKAVYEEMALSGSRNCPICNKAISSLVESEVFKELLKNVPEKALKVEYNTVTKEFSVIQ